jgi:hypothetical protein
MIRSMWWTMCPVSTMKGEGAKNSARWHCGDGRVHAQRTLALTVDSFRPADMAALIAHEVPGHGVGERLPSSNIPSEGVQSTCILQGEILLSIHSTNAPTQPPPSLLPQGLLL